MYKYNQSYIARLFLCDYSGKKLESNNSFVTLLLLAKSNDWMNTTVSAAKCRGKGAEQYPSLSSDQAWRSRSSAPHSPRTMPAQRSQLGPGSSNTDTSRFRDLPGKYLQSGNVNSLGLIRFKFDCSKNESAVP